MYESILIAFVFLLLGGVVTHFYYKKSQKDSSKQLSNIKEEFENLNIKVSNLDLNNIPEKQKKQIIGIDKELKMWVTKLNNDPGSIESKIDNKMSELNLEINKKSQRLRKYMVKLVEKTDNIISELNKEGIKISWEKPTLNANLFEYSEIIKIKLNQKELAKIEIGEYSREDFLKFKLSITDSSSVYFICGITYSNKIELDYSCDNKFKFIDENRELTKETYEKVFDEVLKEIFEYLLIKK